MVGSEVIKEKGVGLTCCHSRHGDGGAGQLRVARKGISSGLGAGN